MSLIALNSLFLALEEPNLKDRYALDTLKFFGDLVSVIFIIECGLKVMVMGFWGDRNMKHAYLRDNYNKLDFLIVCSSIVSWVFEYA